MEQYHWPGNVRELENAIERAVALEKHDEITPWSLPEGILRSVSPENIAVAQAMAVGSTEAPALAVPAEGLNLEQHISQLERRYIEAALKQSGGIGKRAAELLHMSYRSFRHYAKKYRL